MSVEISGGLGQFKSVRIGTYSNEAYNLLRLPQVMPVQAMGGWGGPDTIRVTGYTSLPSDLTTLTLNYASEVQTRSATVTFNVHFAQPRKIDFITAAFSAYGSVIQIYLRGYDDDLIMRYQRMLHSATHNATVIRRPSEPEVLNDIPRKRYALSFTSSYDWMTVGRVGLYGR